MAKFDTNTLSLFHTFSKTQVNSDATKPQYSSLGNTVNKSGHTVQTSEVWADSIPFFGLGVPADFTATAKLNDLVKDADGVIWQRNATAAGAGECWDKKTTSITAFTVGADGKYTYTYTDGALVDGSYLINADGKPVVKYHERKQLTRLVSGNNAFIDSENDASRLKIDGSWVEQFIGVTDAYVNGSASVSYAPVLYATSTATSPLKAGAGEDYLDYCATGIILWDKSEATGNEVINCFEYVGEKLDDTVAKLSAAVFGSGAPSEGDQPASLQQQVAQNTAAINTLNTTTIPAIQQSVTDAITTANGYTDDKIAEELEAGGSIAEAIATAKQGAIDSAKVTLTAGSGISIPNSGTAQTSFTVSVDEGVIATRTYAESQATDKAATALGEAKTYAEGQAATAKSEAVTAANDYTDDEIAKAKTYAEEKAGAVADALNTAKGELTTAIGTAKEQAIAAAKSETESQVSAAKSELTTAIGTAKTEAITAAASDAASKVATAKSELTGDIATAKGEAIAAAKTETETQVAALKTELTSGEGSLAGKVTALQGEVSTIKETTIPAAQAAAEKVATDGIAALKKTLEEGVIAMAQSTAEAAQSAAEAAQDTADTAVANAATAQSAAEAAQGTANTAVDNAATAQAAAEAADAKAAKAATDAAANLATAKSELEGKITAASSAAAQVASDLATAKSELEGKITAAEAAATTAGQNAASAAETAAKGYTDTEVKKVSDKLDKTLEDHATDIQTVTAAVQALTTTGLTREVVADGKTKEEIENPQANVIYLVKDSTSETGAYVEYLYVNGTWEAIGTTSTDLAEYAKTADVTSAIATAKAEAIADAKSKVDTLAATHATDKAALEATISGVSQTHNSDKQALEGAIAALAAEGTGRVSVLESQVTALTTGDTSVASQIQTAINGLGTGVTQGGAGVTLTQTNGVVALTVTSGGVAASGETAEKFVMGKTVHAAIEAEKSRSEGAYAVKDTETVAANAATAAKTADDKAVAAQGTADTAVANAKTADDKAVAAQGTADTAVANAKTADDKAVAAQGTADQAVEDAATAQATADAKIAAVEVATDAASHFGAQHITATTGTTDKKVTITVTRADEWSVGETKPATTITSVINGKMSDGKTIDDANLVNGTSMFAGNTALKTFVGDLGKLTTGTSMFSGCTGLTTFVADLGSLENGEDMFKGCTLTEESLIYIVDSLPTVTSGTICLGTAVDAVLKTEAVAKGWTVVVA